jgi:glycosyltransferase involved in cell wall biosynthesis
MNNPSVVVITPTTGDKKLNDAINSVKNQTYKDVKHLIVVDGEKFKQQFLLEQYLQNSPGDENKNIKTVFLCDNTGGGGFYGHRIYAAFSHLVNEEVVCFLDQDNWYEPNHIEELVKTLYEKNYAWAFSLRNIYDQNKNFLFQDNCESLGKWPIWNSENPDVTIKHHVDTSTYAFRRDFLIKVASIWHHGYAADRIFLNVIRQHFKDEIFETSGKYTLNYRLDGNATSASPDFFRIGNEFMKDKYKENYPWQKAT